MNPMLPQLGKVLIVFGVLAVIAGVILLFADRLPFLGKLPGDIHIKRDGFSLYIPLATMLVVSLLVTVILNLFGRWK